MNSDTERQKRAARGWIEEKATAKSPNKGKVLRNAGYSKSVSDNPKMIMESEGFKTETARILATAGITEENIANCLNADINAKPANRLGELKLASEMLGMNKQTVDLNVSKLEETTDLLKGIIDGDKQQEQQQEQEEK